VIFGVLCVFLLYESQLDKKRRWFSASVVRASTNLQLHYDACRHSSPQRWTVLYREWGIFFALKKLSFVFTLFISFGCGLPSYYFQVCAVRG
jgi:hypothetical protein